MRWLVPGAVAAITLAACSSKDALLEVRDGAADTTNHADAGLGGAGLDAASGRGGATGTGGTSSGMGGASGRGGAAGGPGTGGLGTGGGGGVITTDGGSGSDASGDAVVECSPGYPVGSSIESGDCNTCICVAGGAWACSTHVCPPDAGPEVPPGDAVVECAPGYPVGSSKVSGDCNTCICVAGGAWACSTNVCPPDAGRGPEVPTDGRAIDTSGPACAQVTTQADCQARSDCHAVFADDLPCGCGTPGCCMRFLRCMDGPADCVRPTQFSCTIAEMNCPTPYLLSYRAGCPEGCVLASDCP